MWALLACLLFAGATACGPLDLRPDTLQTHTQPPSDLQAQGRALLRAAAQAQGGDRWPQVRSYRAQLHDTWQGIAILFNPWPSDDVRATVTFQANTFDARADFHMDDARGTSWGLQAWRSYVIDAQGVRLHDSDDIRFILPAIQYLQEFAFRALDGTMVAYAGTEDIGGVTYERVLVTWDALTPTMHHDQYIAYIHPERGLIEKIHYTVRDAGRFMSGTVHLRDFRAIDGLLMPHWQAVTFNPHDDPEADYAHLMIFSELVLNPVEDAFFVVDPTLAPVGNAKLSALAP